MIPENTLCLIYERFSDHQYHILHCKVVQDIRPLEEEVQYYHIYCTTTEEEKLVKVYKIYLCLGYETFGEPSLQSLPWLYTVSKNKRPGPREPGLLVAIAG